MQWSVNAQKRPRSVRFASDQAAWQLGEMSTEEFMGLVMPPGVEKKVLYHSEFRSIATYAMSLADLARELSHIVHARGALIKDDTRRNFSGKCARHRGMSVEACCDFTAACAIC